MRLKTVLRNLSLNRKKQCQVVYYRIYFRKNSKHIIVLLIHIQTMIVIIFLIVYKTKYYTNLNNRIIYYPCKL